MRRCAASRIDTCHCYFLLSFRLSSNLLGFSTRNFTTILIEIKWNLDFKYFYFNSGSIRVDIEIAKFILDNLYSRIKFYLRQKIQKFTILQKIVSSNVSSSIKIQKKHRIKFPLKSNSIQTGEILFVLKNSNKYVRGRKVQQRKLNRIKFCINRLKRSYKKKANSTISPPLSISFHERIRQNCLSSATFIVSERQNRYFLQKNYLDSKPSPPSPPIKIPIITAVPTPFLDLDPYWIGGGYQRRQPSSPIPLSLSRTDRFEDRSKGGERGWCLLLDISSIFIKFCPHSVEP